MSEDSLGPLKIGDRIEVRSGYDGDDSAWLSGKTGVRGRVTAFEYVTPDLLKQVYSGNPKPGQTDKVVRIHLDEPHATPEKIQGNMLLLLLNDRLARDWNEKSVVLVFVGNEGGPFQCVESHSDFKILPAVRQ